MRVNSLYFAMSLFRRNKAMESENSSIAKNSELRQLFTAYSPSPRDSYFDKNNILSELHKRYHCLLGTGHTGATPFHSFPGGMARHRRKRKRRRFVYVVARPLKAAGPFTFVSEGKFPICHWGVLFSELNEETLKQK